MRVFTTLLIFLFLSFGIKAQITTQQLYEKAIQEAIRNGTFDGFKCGNDDPRLQIESASREAAACTKVDAGYGTLSWTPSSSAGTNNVDPACALVYTPASCNGGKFRIPLVITIYECSSWSGTNYLGGSGFSALSNAAVYAKLDAVNDYYAKANIEFYLVSLNRIQDCDLYDFYDTTDPTTGGNDGVNDYTETSASNVANVVNLYFAGGLNGDHDCCGTMGYAYFPSVNYSFMRYGAAVGGTTLEHELGHFFGLYHTHRNATTGSDASGTPDGALNNSDCLTTGDKICDTWPDPNFSVNCTASGNACGADNVAATNPDLYCYIQDPPNYCLFDNAGYLCRNGGNLTIDPNTGSSIDTYTSTKLNENIMSYNLYSGCRTKFTPCQYRKINEVALTECRSYLCDTTVTKFFANTTLNDTYSPYKEICINSSQPTFNAGKTYTDFGGTNYSLSCFNWYTVASGGSPVATSTTSFTPTSAQLNTATPGTYYFYLQEVNSLSTACRSKVRVDVLPFPGNSSPAALTYNDNTTTPQTLSTTGSGFGPDQYTGWIITTTNPSSTTNQAIYTAAQSTTCPTIVTGTSVNCILKDGSSAPTNNLSMDCNVGTQYWAIPFASYYKAAIPAVNCPSSGNINVSGVAIPVNIGGTNYPGKVGTITPASITCEPASPPYPPTFNLIVTITGYTGLANNLIISIRNAAGSVTYINQLFAGNGTYTFTQASSGFPVGYDPALTGNGFYVLVVENGGNGMSAATVTVGLNMYYPGTSVTPFPTITSLNSTCTFGTPTQISCALPLDIDLISFDAKKAGDKNKINWVTSSEHNCGYYILEKSHDALDYEPLSIVNGSGTTNERKEYEVLDTKPFDIVTYYRLTEVDLSDKRSVVGIVSVTNPKSTPEVNVYPNPLKAPYILNADYNTPFEGNLVIELIDITGRPIKQFENFVRKGLNTIQLEIDDMPSGSYIIRMTQMNSVVVSKFVKT